MWTDIHFKFPTKAFSADSNEKIKNTVLINFAGF